MAQWIALGITVAGLVFVFGRFRERLDYMKGEIIQLQTESQTVEERKVREESLDLRFKIHDQKCDMRYETITKNIDYKLDRIMVSVNALGGNGDGSRS